MKYFLSVSLSRLVTSEEELLWKAQHHMSLKIWHHRTFHKGKTNIYLISHHCHSNMVDSHGPHGRWFVKTSSDCKAPAVRSMIMNTVVNRAVRARYTPKKKKKKKDLSDSSSASSISMSSTLLNPHLQLTNHAPYQPCLIWNPFLAATVSEEEACFYSTTLRRKTCARKPFPADLIFERETPSQRLRKAFLTSYSSIGW